jgi:transposase
MSRFIPVDRQTDYLLPPSVDEWLPDGHLARFVVDVVEQLDLSALTQRYTGRGSKAHHPAVLLSLLVYGYATGVYSSRKIERATYDSVAFRYLAANTHPDHDTLANFRQRFLPELEQLFVQVLLLAREMKLLKLGTIALDGTKLKANASKHKALSYGHAKKLEAQFKARIEARAEERDAVEQAAYQEKLTRREAQRKAGKKPRGRDPEPPTGGPRDKDQVNLTDPQSRIMPVTGKGFDQCYNAQAAVDTDTMLVTHVHVTQATNDKQQVMPLLTAWQGYPEALGRPSCLLADTGYFSAANVEACQKHGIEPLFAMKRDVHHLPVFERFAADPPAPVSEDPVEQMAHRLKTRAGRALYALRKHTVEPVFGIIKHVMGFRQFSLRGLDNVSGEWCLAIMAWNIKRMHRLTAG